MSIGNIFLAERSGYCTAQEKPVSLSPESPPPKGFLVLPSAKKRPSERSLSTHQVFCWGSVPSWREQGKNAGQDLGSQFTLVKRRLPASRKICHRRKKGEDGAGEAKSHPPCLPPSPSPAQSVQSGPRKPCRSNKRRSKAPRAVGLVSQRTRVGPGRRTLNGSKELPAPPTGRRLRNSWLSRGKPWPAGPLGVALLLLPRPRPGKEPARPQRRPEKSGGGEKFSVPPLAGSVVPPRSGKLDTRSLRGAVSWPPHPGARP